MNYEDHSQLFGHLPARSREKIRILCDASERAYTAVLSALQTATDARADLARIKAINAQQEGAAVGRRIGFTYTADELALRDPRPVNTSPSRHALTDDEAERLDDRVRVAQERVDRAVAAQEAAAVEWEKYTFLNQVVDWLKVYIGHGGRLGHQKLPDTKLERGETHRQAVERIRGQLAACDKRWAEIEAAPLPAADLKDRITAEIDALVADGRPKIRRQDFGNGVSGVSDALCLRKTGGLYVSDVASPLFAWLHRDALIARLHAEVDAMDLNHAMDDDTREAALATLLDQKLKLSFIEEAFVTAAEQEGSTIPRRRDADPRAILEIREVFADEISERDGHFASSEEGRPARRRAPARQEAAE